MSIEFNGLTLFAGLLVLAMVLILRHNQKRSTGSIVCFALFWIYLLLVSKYTLFPVDFDAGRVEIYKANGVSILSNGNFIPFFFGRFATKESIFLAVSQNVILTMPFGFGINFIQQVKLAQIPWLILIGGVGIECAQLVISLMLGYPYRVVDLNDAISNGAGTLLGYVCFRIFAYGYVALAEKTNNVHGFVYHVAQKAINQSDQESI